MNLFNFKKQAGRIIIKIFGIKISFKQKKNKNTKIDGNFCSKRKLNYIYWPHNRVINYMNDKTYTNQERKWYIEQLFIRDVGYFPNIDNPKTFNEKIHWLSLYYHNPLITTCVDKYKLKEYIANTIGKEYVVPLIGVWDNVNDIDFDNLPQKFAIKVNWGDGERFGFIIKDKTKADIDYIKSQLSDRLQPWQNGYYHSFFWGYKNVVPKIIAEEYIEQPDGKLNDYKLYCYNGVHKHTLICTDRDIKTRYINMDKDWKCIAPSTKSIIDNEFPKPKLYDSMVQIAERLAQPFPFCRVDFYETSNKIYIGEMTFHPNCGFNHYKTEWDLKLGSYLTLPDKWE